VAGEGVEMEIDNGLQGRKGGGVAESVEQVVAPLRRIRGA
jgi:hypothetical protein